MVEDLNNPDDEIVSPETTLKTLRIIWGALIWGQIVIGGVMWFIGSDDSTESAATESSWPILTVASLALLAICVPMAYFLRNQVYKSHWQSEAVTPAGYLKANMLFAMLLDAPAVLSAISTLFAGEAFPHLVPLITAVAIMLINFPHGRPMQSTSVRLGEVD